MFISRLRSVSLIFVLVSFLALPVNALESVHFSFALATLESGLTDAAGVAVDGSGNVYVVDSSSTSVLKVPVGCRFAGCIVTLGSGFNNAQGIAVDGSGDVFVADTYNNAVKEIVAVNGIIPASPTINLLGNGFSFNEPWGIAVDTSGNVYVADYGNTGVNSNMVYELPASGGYQQVKALGSGFFGPTGIAVDASGNVYVADMGHGAVKEIVAVNGSIPASPTINTLSSSFTSPYGVAVDKSGNVYVADMYGDALKEIVAVGGNIPSSPAINTLLDGSSSTINSVAVDTNGNIYLTDYTGGHMEELQVQAVNFGAVAIGQTSATIPLTFTLNGSGSLGIPVALTMGTPNLEFAVSSGGTCAGLTFTSGETCTVNVTFTPKFTGTRYGAAVLYDSSSPASVVGTAYLAGTGTGPQVAFQPGTLSNQLLASNSSLNWLGGIAVDGREYVYLADGLKAVWLLTAPSSGTNYTLSLLGGVNGSSVPNISYDCPQYTAVDGAGNIYVADYGCNTNTPAVYQLALQPNGSYVKNLLGSSWVEPMGVAVDSVGNIYVTDIGTGFVSKLTLNSGSYTPSVIASGIANVNDLAVDSNGNVFVAIDWGTVNGSFQLGSIIKLTPSVSSYAKSTIVSGLYAPSEISIDGNGNLFVADNGGPPNTAYKLTLQTDGNYKQSTILLYTQLKSPVGIAVDGAANQFIVDAATNNVFKLDVADGPTLTFLTATAHGSTDTVDGTLKATIQNIGNAQLTFSSIVASTNFKLDSGTTTCSTTTTLAVNATCVVGVIFTPATSGALIGTVTLTDNAANATQTISLSGSGSVLPPAPVIASGPVSTTIAATATFPFSDTQSGVTFLCSLDSAAYAACTSPANYSSLALGTHNFSVEAVDTSNNISAPATYSWTIINPPPAPTLILYPSSSTTATTATFNFLDGQPNETNQCSLDGAAYSACGATDGNPNGTIIYTSLAIGAHTFAVEAMDSYGNISSPATYNWTITAVPVHVTISTSPSGFSFTMDGTSYTNSASFSWTPGSSHAIATTASQTPAGIQGTFVSWSDGGAISHSVTATAGVTSYIATFTASYLLTTAVSPTGSGTVSPVSGTYYPAGTVVNLTAAASGSNTFGVWSGSVVNPSSAATVITMSAPQSVTANFYPSSIALPEWTWMGGSSTGNQSGAYGTLLTPSLNNLPGGRSANVSWTDSSGNFWIFGGKGYDSAGKVSYLGDLWEFNPTTGWAWMGGSKTVNSAGTLTGAGATPGARQYAVSWTDSSGNFWLLGGYGYDVAGTLGILHDLWEYKPSSGWTFVSGYSTVGNSTGAGGQMGIYGTLGKFDALNLPGSREYAVGWADSNGNLWLFGGQGSDSKGTLGYLNDLWEFSPSKGTAGQWVWVCGSNVASKTSVSYGSKGSPSTTNLPGGRLSATSWADKSGNFWLFGGEGYDANGVFGEMNDLWVFTPSNGWIWVSGSSTTVAYSGQAGVYGTLGTPAATNMPGSRQDATGWTDSNGNLWLLGGLGLDVNGNSAPLGDLWEFNTSTKLWTWMSGGNTTNFPGVYGTPKTPAAGNMPGSRYFASSWIDSNGTPWLFGGYGKDGNSTNGYQNDLWTYGALPTVVPPTVATPVIAPATGTYDNYQTVTITDQTAGTTICYTTTSGATPAASNGVCTTGMTYSGSFSMSAGLNIQAIATLAGSTNSGLAAATYTLQAAPPALNPPGGIYVGAQSVTLTTDTTGAQIFYTTDGSTPSTYVVGPTKLYSSGFPISVSTTGTVINAITVDDGMQNSTVSTGTYVLQYPSASLTAPAAFTAASGATSAAQAATLTNSGTASLTGITPTITGTGAADFAITTGSNACGTTLAAGSSCSIYITFSPASVASFTATLSVADNDAKSPQTAALSGVGTTPPAPIAALTAPAAFTSTTVGATATAQSATLTNSGNAPLTGITPTIIGTNPTDFAITTGSNACGTTLVAGSSCSIYVTFTPASASSFTATLSVADNAANSPQTAALSGVGTAPIVPTFTIASPTGTQTVQPGGKATYTINVKPVNGSYTSAVTLTASGLPAGASATFVPSTVTPGAEGASSVLTIHTAATSASATPAGSLWPLATPALALIGLFFVPGNRHRRWLTLSVLLLCSLGALTALSGCGGGFSLPGAISTNYTVTVTGTSGSAVQTTTVQLTVQ
jgi:hypothetical protein